MASEKMNAELRQELNRLALMSDDEIDTSDIPEVTNWTGAKRGLFAPDQIDEREYDVRALANWFIKRARSARQYYSNMSLNKLVYLALERSLVERRVLLTPARVEAWSHGPVFREVYQAFKDFGEDPVNRFAQLFSVHERAMVDAQVALEPSDLEFLETIFDRYGGRTASQLRAISHIESGPWHTVWHYRGSSNPGMQITPAIIFENAPRLRDLDER